jgi:ACS family tartrate transporter-like MFS transporter
MAVPVVEPSTSVPDHVRRRVAWRLLPYLFLLYIVAFLDRANVSYAALGLASESWINPEVLGFGAGVFFIGYFLLEVPSTIMVERWSARKWMARIMISWGFCASALGFVHSKDAFYIVRFLLGAAEAGFFPGVIVYLGHWFTERDKAKAIAFFYTAVPLSYVVGAPMSAGLMRLDLFGLEGWRWLFIVEGLPAIVLGVLNLWLLTDRPRDARWLAPDDRERLQAAIDTEQRGKPEHLHAFAYLRHPMVLRLTLIYFFAVCGIYGFTLWLPTMLKQVSGLTDTQVSLLTILPYAISFVCVVIFAWNSDRTQERAWHTAIPLFVTAAGLSIGSFIHVTSLTAVMLGFCVVGAGIYTFIPSFWANPARHLSGTAAAVSIGLINSIGNLGGFVGPFVVGWLEARTQSFAVAMGLLLGFQVIAGLLALGLRQSRR